MEKIKVYCVSQAFWLGLKQIKVHFWINKATYALVSCGGRKTKFLKTRGTVCKEDLKVKDTRADCFCQC